MHDIAHVRQLYSVGHYHQAAGCHPMPRLIPKGEEILELMTGGRGWVEIDGAWMEVLPGHLLWHIAGDQTIGRSDFTDPYRCLAIRLFVTSTNRPAPHLSRWDDLEEVRTFTRQAIRWWGAPGADQQALGVLLYGRLLFQARLVQPTVELPAVLVKVLHLIDGAFAEDLGIPALAAAADRSPSQLHALFRSHLDTTPHAYLAARRMRAARELLAVTDLSVGDIAVSCGFSAAAPFCRAFRQEVGLSPAAWRSRQGRSKGGAG